MFSRFQGPKFAIFTFFLGATLMFFVSVLYFQLGDVVKKAMNHKYNSFLVDASDLARYCSSKEWACQAKLNDGTLLSVKLIGTAEQTWVLLGNEKIPTKDFFSEVFLGKYPKGVNGIAFIPK